MPRPFATSRRGFLAISGGAVATAAVYGFSAAPAWAAPSFPQNPFTLGVASGDPTSGGVVLWTRLAPEPQAPDGMGGMPPYQVQVSWQVATDPDLPDRGQGRPRDRHARTGALGARRSGRVAPVSGLLVPLPRRQ